MSLAEKKPDFGRMDINHSLQILLYTYRTTKIKKIIIRLRENVYLACCNTRYLDLTKHFLFAMLFFFYWKTKLHMNI